MNNEDMYKLHVQKWHLNFCIIVSNAGKMFPQFLCYFQYKGYMAWHVKLWDIYIYKTPAPPFYYFKTINKTISQGLIFSVCLFLWISSYEYDATKCGVGKRWEVADHCTAFPVKKE